MITTLPGLYVVSTGIMKVASLISQHPMEDVCTTFWLRCINVGFTVANFFLLLFLMWTIHKKKEVSIQIPVISGAHPGSGESHCVAWQNSRNPHMCIGCLVNEANFERALSLRNGPHLPTTQCACAEFEDFAKQRNGGGGREKDL
jgi:hypothetical protein